MERFISHPRKEIRATTLRLLRFISGSTHWVKVIMHHFQWPIIALLEKVDNGHKKERLQAMQVRSLHDPLARRLTPSSCAHSPACVPMISPLPMVSRPLSARASPPVSSIVAIANTDDPYSEICVGTLCELLLTEPALAISSGAIQVRRPFPMFSD
jgi:hypothetical protein